MPRRRNLSIYGSKVVIVGSVFKGGLSAAYAFKLYLSI